jgi:hypothetical protein
MLETPRRTSDVSNGITRVPKRSSADREIAQQTPERAKRLRSETRAIEVDERDNVDYWKGKPQPKKPRKKSNETNSEFDKRKEQYNKYFPLWKEANKRKQPERRAKRK